VRASRGAVLCRDVGYGIARMTSQVDAHPYELARLVSRRDAGGGMALLEIDVPGEVAGTYVSAGQYTEVRAGGETGYFVLASEPFAHRWHLVMRAGGGASEVLLRMPVGAELEVTAAIGPGFPMTAARGRRVIVALSGTGVAAGRPLVGRRVADGDAARTEVLLGARARSEVAMESDLDRWERAGVRVVVCLSQDDAVAEGTRYVRGYVQDVLRSRATGSAHLPSEAPLIFAVGMPSMVEALRKLAPVLGIQSEDVLTNH
jgi:NAD(P)H-flavin reductase